MLKYVLGFLCVWYSVSVFSKTEIMFEKTAFIGIELSEETIPLFLLRLEED